MKRDIQTYIDRAVGTEGVLRIPSWWMHKILSDLVQYCGSLESSDAGIKEYLESQLNLVGDAVEALDARVTKVESHELFAIVSGLPSEPKENTIYLIPSANGEGNNILTEWVYVNGAWEQFGEFKTDVDLSGYVKKEEGKGLSANDYTDEDKEKVSSLENYDDTEIKEKLTELSAEIEDLSDVVEEAERALNMQPTEVLLDKAFLSGYITGTGYFSTINQDKTYGMYYIPVKKGETYRAIGMYAKLEASYAGITFCEVLPTTAGSYGAIVLEKVGNATPIDYQYVADKDGYLYVFIYDSTGYVNFFGYELKTTFNAKYVEDVALQSESATFNQDFSFIQGEALKANGDVWTNQNAASFARTDYIEVRGYEYLSYQLASNDVIQNICFYDINKVFLNSIKLPSGLNTSFIDLSEHPNAKYIRCATNDFEYHRDSGNIYVKLMAYPYKPSQYIKMLNIGDSLTRTSRWAIHVCDYCHIPAYSQKASSGATMALKGSDSIYQAVQALTAEDDIDLVTIWAGTNDFGSSVEIGDFDVQANAATRDVTTFYGAYMASVEKVLSLYPKARIILIGTTPRTWANGEGDYNTTTIGGKYLREYVDAVKKIAEWYGLPFLDLLRTSGINSKNIAEYMYPQTGSDGTYYLHFSDYGTKQIAKRIAAFIESLG